MNVGVQLTSKTCRHFSSRRSVSLTGSFASSRFAKQLPLSSLWKEKHSSACMLKPTIICIMLQFELVCTLPLCENRPVLKSNFTLGTKWVGLYLEYPDLRVNLTESYCTPSLTFSKHLGYPLKLSLCAGPCGLG